MKKKHEIYPVGNCLGRVDVKAIEHGLRKFTQCLSC